jgi:hypothetical protein
LSRPFNRHFFLVQDHSNRIETIPAADAVSRMMRQVAPPLAPDDRARRQIMEDSLSFSDRIIADVLHYELMFTHRDDSFWRTIDALHG